MTTQTLIAKLFDYQKFERRDSLQKVIDSTLSAEGEVRELALDELDVWAAGDPDMKFFDSTENRDDD